MLYFGLFKRQVYNLSKWRSEYDTRTIHRHDYEPQISNYSVDLSYTYSYVIFKLKGIWCNIRFM